MNRGVLQLHKCLPVMAGGNPIWPWDINGLVPLSAPQSSPFMATANSYIFSGHPYCAPTSSLPLQPVWHDNQEQELPESLSQLMTMGGFVGEEADKCAVNDHYRANKLENWEEQVLLNNSPSSDSSIDVKQEDSASSYVYGHESTGNNCQVSTMKTSNWAPVVSALSPRSGVTSLSSGMQDFSSRKNEGSHPPPDRTSETNSNATAGGAPKKAKLQPSSSQSSIKVRKEKLGDRISALHQLVSPFGKTDTASVLLEAIGYIRFLQNQIEALSLPYMGNASGTMRHPQPVQGERGIFPEDTGQLLNGNCMKRKLGAPQQDSHEELTRDLRSRGLCLVPVSSTLHIGSNNGADYWASAFGGGFR